MKTTTMPIKIQGETFKSMPSLSLEQIYPEPVGGVNLNTCGDPDCGNFGVPLRKDLPERRGNSEALVKLTTADKALSVGLGVYTMASTGLKRDARASSILEYKDEPRARYDARTIKCGYRASAGRCNLVQTLLSNQQFHHEALRLHSMNGLLSGPSCGDCGQHYLHDPTAFALDGANVKKDPRGDTHSAAAGNSKTLSVRVVCKRCRGKKGARFTISPAHRRQKDRSANIRILRELVNERGLNDIRRRLASPDGESTIGMSRLYDRIIWLESVLLAYERAQLERWRSEQTKQGKFRHHRIAHDDIVLGVNWETKSDRRITQLNCSVSADIASGYVFRMDVDFDPNVDPVELLMDYYGGRDGPPSLRLNYQKADGSEFSHPMFEMQRPTGLTRKAHSSLLQRTRLPCFKTRFLKA